MLFMIIADDYLMKKKENEMLGFLIVFVAIIAIRYISDWFKK